MKRLSTILFSLSLPAFVGVGTYVLILHHRHREFNLGEDLRHARGVLNRVRLGESRCYKIRGQYAALQDLDSLGCGGIEGALSSGEDDGFRVEVHASADGYSVRVHPLDSRRLHSLYSDQTEAIHLGTRDRPATADSYLLKSWGRTERSQDSR